MGAARYKCETCDKNRRESHAEAKFRKTLSFSAYQFRVMSYEFAIANVMI